MVDTARTKTALAAILADNTAGEISPQDVRDFLETMHPSFGSLHFSTAAETSIATQSVYVKAAGTTTSVNLHRVTMPADNRLTYTGTPTIHAHIACSLSMTAAGNNKLIGLGIAKNGTVLTHSIVQRQVGTGADVGSTALHADVSLATNDYLELWVSNETDTVNLTIELGYLFFLAMMT